MDSLASKEVVDHILSHHGVKGMHWGVRRGDSSGGGSSGGGSSSKKGPKEVSVKTRSGSQHKTMIITKGGQGHPAHPDAIAAKVVAQKLKKSGTHALSNDELQKLATRHNLEQQARRTGAGTSTLAKGAKHVTNFLKTPEGKTAAQEATKLVTSESGKKVVKRVLKGAAVAAAVTR